MVSGLTWARQWDYGIIDNSYPEELYQGCRTIYNAISSEIIMYLTMAQEAEKGHLTDVTDFFMRYANELCEYVGILGYMLGVNAGVESTLQTNVQNRVIAQQGKCQGLYNLARTSKAQNLDALHDYLDWDARDAAVDGKALEGQGRRYLDISSFV